MPQIGFVAWWQVRLVLPEAIYTTLLSYQPPSTPLKMTHAPTKSQQRAVAGCHLK